MNISDIILELFRHRTAHQRAAFLAHQNHDQTTYLAESSKAAQIAVAINLLAQK